LIPLGLIPLGLIPLGVDLPGLDDAFALLRLQFEWGADEAIDPDPVGRLRPVEPRPVAVSRPVPVAEAPMGTAGERAVALAGRAGTLDDLRAAVAGFDGCALRDTASNLVFAEGDPASTTLIVGEPPGREEDRSGHPFTGAEGQLLDQMLASIGVTRAALMLTPLLPWRPPGGRPPSPAEIAICLPFLHRLIVLLEPHRIVLFGGHAGRTLLPQALNRRRAPRGWVEAGIPGMRDKVPMLALPGLADMLRNPPLRREAWTGLRLLRRALDQAQTQT
jgi:uracil-DNA glycosylase